MANSQVTTRDTQLEKQRIGLLRLSMTNFGNTSEPAIAAGSVVEIGGSLFVFTSNEAITGWGAIGNDTDCYIRLPYNGALTAEFTTVAPTWSASKQGWYDGIKRYVAGLHRGASAAAYEDKWVYRCSQDDNDTHRFYGDGTVDFDDGIKGDLDIGSDLNVTEDVNITGNVATHNRILPNNYFNSTTPTEAEIYTALVPYLPTNGDKMLMTGGVGKAGGSIIVSYAVKSTNHVTCYGINSVSGVWDNADFEDGNASTFIAIDVSW